LKKAPKLQRRKFEEEIFDELSKAHLTVPWLKNVEKVTVMEN